MAVHAPAYVEVVKRMSDNPHGAEANFGIGPGDNPPFPGMFEASLLHVGATQLACDRLGQGSITRAYNLGGGFHHAMPARASGFCIFNDVAVGLHRLLATGFRRVLYVDIDAHHGDGVQAVFYRDPRVLTISLHEDGRYLFPGTGFVEEIGEGEGRGFAVNVPLPPYTRDAGWTYAFESVVPTLAEAFRPDVLLTQTGADAHATDPLTHLEITTQAYERAGASFDELSRRWCADRWIAVGGGGYDLTATPRVWTLLFGAQLRRRPRNPLPEPWLESCRRRVRAEPRASTLRDPSVLEEDGRVSRAVREVVDRVRAQVFPHHGIRP